VRRSISVLICWTWASADARTALVNSHNSKRLLSISSTLMETPGLKPSPTLSRFLLLPGLLRPL